MRREARTRGQAMVLATFSIEMAHRLDGDADIRICGLKGFKTMTVSKNEQIVDVYKRAVDALTDPDGWTQSVNETQGRLLGECREDEFK